MITATLTAFSSNQLMCQHDLDNSGKLNEESQSWDLFPLNLMSMFLCVLRPALNVCPTFSPSRPEIRGLNPSANRSAAVFAYAYYTNANMRGAAQDQPSSSTFSPSSSSSSSWCWSDATFPTWKQMRCAPFAVSWHLCMRPVRRKCTFTFCKRKKNNKHVEIKRRENKQCMALCVPPLHGNKRLEGALANPLHRDTWFSRVRRPNTNVKPDAPISSFTIIYLWMNILQLR